MRALFRTIRFQRPRNRVTSRLQCAHLAKTEAPQATTNTAIIIFVAISAFATRERTVRPRTSVTHKTGVYRLGNYRTRRVKVNARDYVIITIISREVKRSSERKKNQTERVFEPK